MSMYDSKERETLETCPYNASHRIEAKKFMTHLVKCRIANPTIEMATCPLYAEHKVPRPELAYHVADCAKKIEFERQVYQEQPTTSTKYEVLDSLPLVESEEVWDVVNTPSYNPQEYCEQNKVIRQMKVQPPSVRRNFRIGERQRHQMLNHQEASRAARPSERPSERPKFPAISETSERECSTTTSMSDQVASLSTDEGTKSNDGWTKIRGRRGRGRGGKR